MCIFYENLLPSYKTQKKRLKRLWLYCYFEISVFRNFGISLFRYNVISLYRYIVISKFDIIAIKQQAAMLAVSIAVVYGMGDPPCGFWEFPSLWNPYEDIIL